MCHDLCVQCVYIVCTCIRVSVVYACVHVCLCVCMFIQWYTVASLYLYLIVKGTALANRFHIQLVLLTFIKLHS